MKAENWHDLLLSVFTFLITSVMFSDLTEAQIIGKISTVCNGPCGQLTLSCPSGHRLAIRDAVYSVQQRTRLCKAFTGCTLPNQDVCCDLSINDCAFTYLPAQMRVVHRNCSGKVECLIQTSRSEAESQNCLSILGPLLSSQTILNYVCIRDTLVTEICSLQEAVIQGRALFAMMEPRGLLPPMNGSICTCRAESVKRSATNTIAVVLVDMRLNLADSAACSNISLFFSSGNRNRTVNCETMKDPLMNLPFATVLNDSDVATLRLESGKDLPEFVWLGFLANENEDIQLTCKMEKLPAVSLPPNDVILRDLDAILDQNAENKRNSGAPVSKKNVLSIVGPVIGAILLVTMVTFVVVVVIRKYKGVICGSKTTRCPPEFDVTYYSTTEETLRNFQNTPEKRISRANSSSVKEHYVLPDKVIANKKKVKGEQGRRTSQHALTGEEEAEYASTLEVLQRKHRSRREKNARSPKNNMDDNYDRLSRQATKSLDTILESYDHLDPEIVIWDSYSFSSGVKVKKSKKNEDPENKRGSLQTESVNAGFDDTNDTRRKLSVIARDKEMSDYFELERLSGKGHSNASYFSIEDLPPPIPAKASAGLYSIPRSVARTSSSKQPSDSFAQSISSLDNESDEVYDDAQSEAQAGTQDKIEGRKESVIFAGSQEKLAETDEAKEDTADIRSDGQTAPIAAPRRKSRTKLVQHVD